jgi:hypothetical protein
VSDQLDRLNVTPAERAMAERHLAQAEAAVRLGRAHIERQCEIILELERDGHDFGQAKDLLATFRDVQTQHEVHRDRLLAELGFPEKL